MQRLVNRKHQSEKLNKCRISVHIELAFQATLVKMTRVTFSDHYLTSYRGKR